MPSQCKYAQLVIQMYLKGLSSRELAAQANMNYQTLRRKMRGDSPVTLKEALRIRTALGSALPLEELFAEKGGRV